MTSYWDSLSLCGVTDPRIVRAVMSEMTTPDIAECYNVQSPVPDFGHNTIFLPKRACRGGVNGDEYLALSRKFPEILFVVGRDAEDDNGMLRAYYKDGKVAVYYPIITWPDFDEADLEEGGDLA